MEYKLHPIQPRFVAVRELFIKTFYPPSVGVKYDAAEGQIEIGSAQFDPKTQLIQISMKYSSGREEEPSEEDLVAMKTTQEQPFRIVVQIVAEFVIDTTRFPAEKIPLWAKVNAPAIMHPFLREHVFGLTARCGLNPLILPMIHVPAGRETEPLVTGPKDGFPLRDSNIVGHVVRAIEPESATH